MLVVFSGLTLYADEIYLKNGSVIRARVLEITEDNVIAQGENESVPKQFFVDELLRIQYNSGKVVTFSGSARVAKKEQAEQGCLPPTHHIDGEPNIFLIISGGLGMNYHPDVITYSEQLAQRYLDNLKDKYNDWDSNTVESMDDAFCLDLNFDVDLRIMSDKGFGVGINGGYSRMLLDTVSIRDFRGDETVVVKSNAYFRYLALSLYLKEYLATRNSMAYYLIAGAGMGIYWGHAEFIIREGDPDASYGTPDRDIFEGEFTGKAYGYHGVLEFGVEQKPFVLLAGLKIRYAEIEEMTSKNGAMVFRNGSMATLRLNGAMLYAGAGVFF